ncbi:hypothetical protein INT45_010689 [Circinella minor]|uniref:Calponin-homology (CH) domain-containing protein n=1 Tax=Circinella minor TaxID=1195481 RepID=A0A8H7S3N3_9FUNG|nr:hypothetical protein INT45_010689 [Circinella minor]
MAPLYGIDREIHRKIQSKYSIELEQEAREWIESVIGEPLPSDDFHESLKDGVILCNTYDYLSLRMIGKFVPGEGKYKDSKIPFMQMENISKFLSGAERLGVPTLNFII